MQYEPFSLLEEPRLASDNPSPRLWIALTARRKPALVAAIAYAAYALLGAALLSLPVMRDSGRAEPLGFVDALFMSTSAVSTTGLVTLDPGSTFSFAGELVLLVLIQIGGLGYMTFMSLVYLILRQRLSPTQARLARSGFGLPDNFEMASFIRRVVASSLVIEAIGAAILAYQFAVHDVANPVWNGIFHSVSAFCTAGFSLFPTSFEAFRGDTLILLVIGVLSYLGALGFVVIAECFEAIAIRPRHLSITTRITVRVTFWMLIASTGLVWVLEPGVRALPLSDQLPNALFQVMSASTTVGFNSMPIGALSSASIMVLYVVMFVGASPAGTGGGLKSTTAAALMGIAVASIRGREEVRIDRYVLPQQRVIQAAGTLVIALLVLFAAVTLLDITGNYPFDKLLFEVISAMATVGLSMGITSELNDAGKLIITAVMLIGRIGILTVFVAFATAADDDDAVLRRRDIIL